MCNEVTSFTKEMLERNLLKRSDGLYFRASIGSDLKIDLPIKKTPSGETIALFDPLYYSGVIPDIAFELLVPAISMVNKNEFVYIVSAESKGPVIAQTLAKLMLGYVAEHIILKKSKPWYYECEEINTSTVTSGEHTLYLPKPYLEKIPPYSHIIFVDDVYSSGNTFNKVSEYFKDKVNARIDGLFVFNEVTETPKEMPENIKFLSWIPLT